MKIEKNVHTIYKIEINDHQLWLILAALQNSLSSSEEKEANELADLIRETLEND